MGNKRRKAMIFLMSNPSLAEPDPAGEWFWLISALRGVSQPQRGK
jgi:hypothetical protein